MRLERLRLLAVSVSLASLAACGGGGGGSSNPPGPPPPPPPPPAARCVDPTPAATSTVKFAAPAAPAASSVELSTNGLSACFLGAAASGAKADVAVATSDSSFYYFEAKRSQLAGVSFGVSASAATEPPSGGFVPRSDTLVISGADLLTVDAAGAPQTNNAGAGLVFGFAVDMRTSYPVVSVIAPASVNASACVGLAPTAPCVVQRWQFAAPASALSIYAYGSGNGTTGPRVTINTGTDQAANPYAYGTAAVLVALRKSKLQGDRGFNPQWPAASGPASLPTLARASSDRAVIRKDDTTPLPTALAVTPTNAAGGVINWKDETGAAYPSGASLALNNAAIAALGVGEHVLTASVVNPQTGRYGEITFRLLVVATGDNTDHDGDGFTYDQEKSASLEPGNADTDGDGLSDGAEAASVPPKNPLVADNDADASLPRRAALVYESGTSRGLIVGDDGLSVVFTGEINPACVQHVAPFDAPEYFSVPFGNEERCRKRAIRANAGVAKGEFRYFETRRIVNALQPADLPNIGHGIITPGAQIDPYCCYIDPDVEASIFPFTDTPPSMTVNSVGGVFVKLIQINAGFSPDFSRTNTDYYGFAVDYTGADPKVYVVMRDDTGAMTVSQVIDVAGFADAAAMPMLHGHPTSETSPGASMNLGLQKFHYDLAAVKAALDARGADTTDFKPGVGAHRWQ
jgi:hypothetical protein